MSNFSSKEEFVESFKLAVSEQYGRNFEDTYPVERYVVLGDMVRDYAGIHWKETKNAVKESHTKQLYYFSMEFLMGRLLRGIGTFCGSTKSSPPPIFRSLSRFKCVVIIGSGFCQGFSVRVPWLVPGSMRSLSTCGPMNFFSSTRNLYRIHRLAAAVFRFPNMPA